MLVSSALCTLPVEVQRCRSDFRSRFRSILIYHISLHIYMVLHMQVWLRNTVALCATLHDMADWKYCNSEKAGISEVKTFLASQNTPPAVSYVVEHVLAHIGFKEALDKKSVQQVPDIPAATAAGPAGMDERAAHVMRGDHAQVTQRCSSDNSNSTPGPAAQDPSPCGFIAGQPASTEDFVLRIVQDADRLDALGVLRAPSKPCNSRTCCSASFAAGGDLLLPLKNFASLTEDDTFASLSR